MQQALIYKKSCISILFLFVFLLFVGQTSAGGGGAGGGSGSTGSTKPAPKGNPTCSGSCSNMSNVTSVNHATISQASAAGRAMAQATAQATGHRQTYSVSRAANGTYEASVRQVETDGGGNSNRGNYSQSSYTAGYSQSSYGGGSYSQSSYGPGPVTSSVRIGSYLWRGPQIGISGSGEILNNFYFTTDKRYTDRELSTDPLYINTHKNVGLYWTGNNINFSTCTGTGVSSTGATTNDFNGISGLPPIQSGGQSYETTGSVSVIGFSGGGNHIDLLITEPVVGTYHTYTITCQTTGGATASDFIIISNGGIIPITTQCNDTDDNDVDGFNNYPNDPGCTSLSDDDETNILPPPPPPMITANGQSTTLIVRRNTPVTIEWDSNGNTNCTLSLQLPQGTVTTGSEIENPSSESLYTITCDQGTESVVVKVLPGFQET